MVNDWGSLYFIGAANYAVPNEHACVVQTGITLEFGDTTPPNRRPVRYMKCTDGTTAAPPQSWQITMHPGGTSISGTDFVGCTQLELAKQPLQSTVLTCDSSPTPTPTPSPTPSPY